MIYHTPLSVFEQRGKRINIFKPPAYFLMRRVKTALFNCLGQRGKGFRHVNITNKAGSAGQARIMALAHGKSHFVFFQCYAVFQLHTAITYMAAGLMHPLAAVVRHIAHIRAGRGGLFPRQILQYLLYGHLGGRHGRRLYKPLVHHGPVFKVLNIAGGGLQHTHKLRLYIRAAGFAFKLQRTRGVLQNLHGFQTADFIKKPPAAGIHQHGVALHFQQHQRGAAVPPGRFRGVAQEKFVLCVQAAVQHQFNIIIARGPGVFKIFPSAGIKIFGHLISDKIQRFAQRGAPFLVPARVPAGITAAVGPPAFHPVETAPGRVFKNLCFILRRKLLQKFAVHRQMHVRQALHIFEAVSQGHIGKFLVVAVCFAVGGNMHQLRFGAAGIGAHQAAGKIFAAFKRIRKSNPLRDGPVIKKQSDFFSGR